MNVEDQASETVRIEIPADSRYLALVRMAAAGMIAELDPRVDEVEDLRVAVDEMIGILLDTSHRSTERSGGISLEMRLEDNVIVVSAMVVPDGDGTDELGSSGNELGPDELSRRILDATVDEYQAGSRSFSLRKTLRRV